MIGESQQSGTQAILYLSHYNKLIGMLFIVDGQQVPYHQMFDQHVGARVYPNSENDQLLMLPKQQIGQITSNLGY